MSNKTEKNIWKHKRIAPLEYCSISRAASILECEESDILHWCYTGKINLCINIQRMYFFYTPFFRDDGPIKNQIENFNNEILPKGDGIPYAFSDKFKSGYFYIPEKSHLLETRDYYLVQTYTSGIWPIDTSVLLAISQGLTDSTEINLFTESNPEFKPSNEKCQIISPILINKQFVGEIINNEEGDIKYLEYLCDHAPDLNDKRYNLQITGYNIEYLYKHAISGDYMPTIRNNSDSKPLTSYQSSETPPIRTTAKQSTYIAALMHALGISEEMMRFGSINQIRELLSLRAGGDGYLPEITDDTLDDWLKRAGKR